MTKRIQLYSDCDFFAGCENMIAVIMNNSGKFPDANINFYYRDNDAYVKGLKARLNSEANTQALYLLNFSGFFLGKNDFVSKNLRRLMHIVRFLLIPLIVIQNFFVLSRHFKNTRPELLYINNGGFPGALSCRVAAIAAKIFGVPQIFMTVNNTAIPYNSLFRCLAYPLDKLVKKSVDTFITASENASLALQQVLKVGNKQRKVFYNCIETHRFSCFLEPKVRDERVVFANVALLEKRKGHIILLKAVNELINRRPDLRQNIVFNIDGDGREKKYLEEYVSSHGLDDVIHFMGSMSQIGLVYQSCDVFILPSIANEDLPNVISEALLFSKPIIASRLAGIPSQVIDGENGYLIEPGSIKWLSAAIERCVDNKDKLESMGKKSKEIFLEKFSVDAALANYLKLFG